MSDAKSYITIVDPPLMKCFNFFVLYVPAIAHFHSYPSVLAASVWIGLNKGLRTVFMALVIPSYVPLDRLPGATGLQLLFAGIFYLVMGPVIGKSLAVLQVSRPILYNISYRLDP